jgi:cob(I)alamin adenosyltransferase
MKIYTKTGDDGQTGLPGGRRVAKDAAVTEVCGAIDELNTAIGLARAAGGDCPNFRGHHVPMVVENGTVPFDARNDVDALLDAIQSKLFDLGAEVARLGAAASSAPRVVAANTLALEAAIDRFEAELPPLRNFILPGGTVAAAQLHFARAVCRRAERRLVGLLRECPGLSPEILIYLNRLGDLLFVLARLINVRAGQPESIWKGT